MRRLLFWLFPLLGVLFSCTPEEGNSTQSFPQGPVDVEYVATLERALSKTTISGTKLLWAEGDEISLMYDGGAETLTVASAGETAVFPKLTVPSEKTCYGVYPHSLGAVLDIDDNGSEGIILTVPDVQDGDFAEANIALARAEGDTLAFKNLCGILKFTVTDDRVHKIVLKALNGEVLTGDVRVTFTKAGMLAVSLRQGQSELTVNISGVGEYYAAVLPLMALKGYKMSIYDNAGNVIKETDSQKLLSLTRSVVEDLGSADADIVQTDWFVTPSGTKDEEGNDIGDGKTWETAISYQQMAYALAVTRTGENTGAGSTEKNEEHALQIDGTRWYLMEGEYTSANYVRISFPQNGSRVRINITGGFSADSKGTDLSLRNPGSSVIKGSGENSVRQFYVKDWADITFDGIEFSGGVGDATYGGGAVFFNPDEDTDTDFCSSLTCVNCKFTSCTSSGKGGAILQNGGKLILDNCAFQYCSATADGGVIYADSNAEVIVRNGCSFKDCSATDRGGFMYAYTATVAISDAVIDKCSSNPSKTSSKYGGAMYLGGGGSYSISDSAISDCQGTYGGGIYLTSDGSVLNVENTKFTGNSALDNRGGAISLGSSCKCYLNQCHFENNTAKTYGGALHCGNVAGKYFLNNCTFVGNYTTNSPGAGSGSAYWMKGGNLYASNCMMYNNYKPNVTSGASDLRFGDADSEVIMVNTTVVNDLNVDYTDGVISNVIGTGKTASLLLMNNVILSGKTSSISSMNHVVSNGFNYVSAGFTASSTDTVLETTDLSTIAQVGDNPWYSCSALSALTDKTKVEEVRTALAGTDFLTWLDGLTVRSGNGTAKGALGYDIAGNSRGEGLYTPGCYQGQ